MLADAPSDSPLGRNGSYVARAMLEYKWGYKDGLLAHWTAGDVEEFLLDHVPRKLTQRDGEAEDNADCVIGLLEFLDDEGLLEGDTLGTLRRVAESLRSEAANAAADPRRWGPAKAIFARAAAEGLDVQDPRAVEAWMEDFNARPFEERDRILGPSLDPLAGPAPKRAPGSQNARRRKRKSERAARKRNRR